MYEVAYSRRQGANQLIARKIDRCNPSVGVGGHPKPLSEGCVGPPPIGIVFPFRAAGGKVEGDQGLPTGWDKSLVEIIDPYVPADLRTYNR